MKKLLLITLVVTNLLLIPAGSVSANPPANGGCPPGYAPRPFFASEDEMACANLELYGVMAADGTLCVRQNPQTTLFRQPRFELMLP